MRTKLIALVVLLLLVGSMMPVEAKKAAHQVTDYDVIKQKYVDGSITYEQFIALTRPKITPVTSSDYDIIKAKYVAGSLTYEQFMELTKAK